MCKMQYKKLIKRYHQALLWKSLKLKIKIFFYFLDYHLQKMEYLIKKTSELNWELFSSKITNQINAIAPCHDVKKMEVDDSDFKSFTMDTCVCDPWNFSNFQIWLIGGILCTSFLIISTLCCCLICKKCCSKNESLSNEPNIEIELQQIPRTAPVEVDATATVEVDEVDATESTTNEMGATASEPIPIQQCAQVHPVPRTSMLQDGQKPAYLSPYMKYLYSRLEGPIPAPRRSRDVNLSVSVPPPPPSPPSEEEASQSAPTINQTTPVPTSNPNGQN